MTEQKQPKEQEPLIGEVLCASCQLNLLELIGFIKCNRELLIKCKSCGVLQGILLEGEIITPQPKLQDTVKGRYFG